MAPGTSGAFLTRISDESRSMLFVLGRQSFHPAGRVVWQTGQTARTVAVVLSGRLKVTITTRRGTEYLVNLLAEGDLVGEMSSITGSDRTACVTAVEDVRILQVPTADFDGLLQSRADMTAALLRIMADRVLDADDRWEAIDGDVEHRVARQLVRLAGRFGAASDDGIRIDIALTQDELAGLVWSTRGGVARALRTLRDDDLVTTRRRQIVVRDLDALRRRVEGALA